MSKIVEGLWDCPYCGAKGIGGLTKHCPNCSHPQDEGTRFYLGEKKKYLDDETAAGYGNGADWVCAYCGSYNRHSGAFCVNCGASREEKKGDYFSTQPPVTREYIPASPVNKKRQWNSSRYASTNGSKLTKRELIEQYEQRRKKRLKIIGIALAIIILLLTVALIPRTKEAQLAGKVWEREIEIEQYTTVKESDWSVPYGGRVYDQQREIHHYDHVIDHYEDVEVQHSREVFDGYDYSTSYSDNGDGTFTEETTSTPRYRTEYYYETESRPVYRDDPVYATKYYYEIERWIYSRSVVTSGADTTPQWGDTVLSGNEREGSKYETYTLIFETGKGKTYTVNVSESYWNSCSIGDEVTLTLQGGTITKIDGTPVS